MRIAQVLAGISLAEADVLRKAVGKKDAALIKAELGKFIEKAVARGYAPKVIDDIAGQIETLGRYGFKQFAFGRLFGRVGPHGLAQDALHPPSSWRRCSEPDRRHRVRHQVHQRGARAGLECWRPTSTRAATSSRCRRQAHPLRVGAGAQRGQRRDRRHPRGAREAGPFPTLFDCASGGPAPVQQARVRGATRAARSTASAATARSSPACLDSASAARCSSRTTREGTGLAVRAASTSTRTRPPPRCPTSRRGARASAAVREASIGFYIVGHTLGRSHRVRAVTTHKVTERARGPRRR